jgi:hypothetical protein
MNFFEKELRKLIGQSNALADTCYIGRACYGRVSDNIRVKLQFVTMGTHEHYEALKATLINNTEGEIDRNTIPFLDIWGNQSVNSPYLQDGVSPHIWKGDKDYEWYGYQPTPADYETLADSVDDYLEMFSENMEYGQSIT